MKLKSTTVLIMTSMSIMAHTNPMNKPDYAIFAGGCFWCTEAAFEKVPGVTGVTSGYIGGTNPNPTYQNYPKSGHIEAVKITYDPTKVTYKQLLDTFWHNINPTDAGGQFNDRGPQYRTAIFYHHDSQKQQAEASKKTLEASHTFDKPIVTEVLQESTFYPAEPYPQNYATKNPISYKYYRWRSGRDQYFKKSWGT